MQRYLQALLFVLLIPFWSHSSEPIINVHVLTGPKARNNTVIPVVISVKSDRMLEGEFIISSTATNAHIYRIPISVGQGSFRYEVAYFLSTAEGDSVDLHIQFRGNVKGGLMQIPYPLESIDMPNRDELTVGWVASGGVPPDVMWFGKPGDVEFKLATKASFIDSEFGQNDNRWGDDYYLKMKRGLIHFNLLHPQMLPTDFRLYDAFDVVYLSAQSVRKMGMSQSNTLAKWVSQGGRLVVEGNAFASAYDNYPIRARLPKVEALEGSSLVQVPMGLGVVVRSQIDIDPSVRLFSDSAVLFSRQLAEKSIVPEGTLHQFSRYSYGWGTRDGALTQVPLWGNILHRWVQLESVSKTAMISLLLVFVILVTVVDRLILHRYKRLHFTWITTSVVVIIFCFMVNYSSTLIRGTKPRQTSLRILDIGADGSARSSQLTCFIPSRSKQYTFTSSEFGQIQHYSYSNQPGHTFIGGKTLNMASITPNVWSSAFLRTVEPVEQANPMDVLLKNKGERLQGTVIPADDNESQHIVSVVRYQGNTYEVKDGSVSTYPVHSYNPLTKAIQTVTFDISPDFSEVEGAFFYYNHEQEEKSFDRLMTKLCDPAVSHQADRAYPKPPYLQGNTAWVLSLMLESRKTGVADSKLKSIRLVRQQVNVVSIQESSKHTVE